MCNSFQGNPRLRAVSLENRLSSLSASCLLVHFLDKLLVIELALPTGVCDQLFRFVGAHFTEGSQRLDEFFRVDFPRSIAIKNCEAVDNFLFVTHFDAWVWL